jgi:hypothetical protein
MITLAHLRVRHETGANLPLLLLGVATTLGTFVVFATTTLVHEPATAVTLVGIILLSVLVDALWTRARSRGDDGRRGAPTLRASENPAPG